MQQKIHTLFVVTGIIAGLLFVQSQIDSAAQAEGEDAVVKVADAKIGNTEATHPIDPAIAMAKGGRKRCNGEVRDYTATLVRRERVNGALKLAFALEQPVAVLISTELAGWKEK